MPAEKRVLVVDDTRFFRAALSDLLREEGWEVFEASDGKEAVQEALRRASHLDLILLDLQLPELDGFEVLRQLKNDAKARRVPVLAMTSAQPDMDQLDVLKSLGASGFIDKTRPIEEILQRIRLSTERLAAS